MEKVVIVTGAARGIGLALAKHFCNIGCSVVLADIEASGLEAAIADIRGEGGSARCIAVEVDVRSRASVDRMTAEALKSFGRIDVMVCNAGVWKSLTNGPFWQLPVAEWQHAFQVNTEGAFNCISSVAPHMIEQGSGRIILIGSTAIGEALAKITHYAASKAALIGLMRCAAKELGPSGITVNMVHPGQTDTGAFSRQQLEARASGKFIPHVIGPDDLVGVVSFLAGDDSRFITAQQINVDGGGVLN